MQDTQTQSSNSELDALNLDAVMATSVANEIIVDPTEAEMQVPPC